MNSSINLVEQLKESMKDAMRAKDKVRLGAIRMALAAVKQIEVDSRVTLSDAETLAVLTKMVKQRRDSIAQYTQANRQDLADAEQAEIEVIESFLPEALSEAEISKLIDVAIESSDAKSMADMSKVMALLKPKITGRADMGVVSSIIKSKLK